MKYLIHIDYALTGIVEVFKIACRDTVALEVAWGNLYTLCTTIVHKDESRARLILNEVNDSFIPHLTCS